MLALAPGIVKHKTVLFEQYTKLKNRLLESKVKEKKHSQD